MISIVANEVKDNKDGEKKSDGTKEPGLDPDALARVGSIVRSIEKINIVQHLFPIPFPHSDHVTSYLYLYLNIVNTKMRKLLKIFSIH